MLKLWGAGLIVLSPVLLALSRWAKHWQEDRLLEAFLEALDGCMGSKIGRAHV